MRRWLSILAGMFVAITLAAQAEEAKTFTLNTNAFLDEGVLPVLYTCDGKDISPQLDWTNIPAKTEAFSLIMTDPDAPGGTFYHWIVYNIPKNTTELAQGSNKLPAGALTGKNGFGKMQYNGPCPPKRSSHTYLITLYALDSKLDLTAGVDGKKVEEAIQKHIVGKVKLTAVYSRWLT